MMNGVIKFFNKERGFGFVTQNCPCDPLPQFSRSCARHVYVLADEGCECNCKDGAPVDYFFVYGGMHPDYKDIVQVGDKVQFSIAKVLDRGDMADNIKLYG